MTRGYHNLLQKEEAGKTQIYLWDGNVAGMKEETGNGQNGPANAQTSRYYLQDELGSPIRLMDNEGNLRETYGYDEFGQDLYGNQGEAQPFGYTGYQNDRITGTYYAQAREYRAELGRFAGRDIIKGYTAAPYTMNEYGYCWGNPMILVDMDGKSPVIPVTIPIPDPNIVINVFEWLFNNVIGIETDYEYGSEASEGAAEEMGIEANAGIHYGGEIVVINPVNSSVSFNSPIEITTEDGKTISQTVSIDYQNMKMSAGTTISYNNIEITGTLGQSWNGLEWAINMREKGEEIGKNIYLFNEQSETFLVMSLLDEVLACAAILGVIILVVSVAYIVYNDVSIVGILDDFLLVPLLEFLKILFDFIVNRCGI